MLRGRLSLFLQTVLLLVLGQFVLLYVLDIARGRPEVGDDVAHALFGGLILTPIVGYLFWRELRRSEDASRDRTALTVQKASRDYLDAVINSVGDPIFVKDRGHRWVLLNDAYCRFMGYPRGRLLGMSDPDFFPEEQARVFWEKDDRVFETGEEDVNEELFTDASGRTRVISTRKSLYVDGAGQPFIVGVIRDVTERKRAEEEVKLSNAMLRTQQEVSIDGILVVGEDRRILSFNRRFARMWGIPTRVLESLSDVRALASALPKLADPQGFLQRVAYLYEHPEERGMDEVLLKDGRVFERYTAPMHGPDGRYWGRVWFFRDITERRRAEEERSRLEELLRQSQKLEAMGRLASGFAHDFGNLLSAVMGSADLVLADTRPGDPRAADLRAIQEASRKAVGMVRQLLVLGRRQALRLERLCLNEVIGEMQQMLGRLSGDRIALDLRLEEGLWSVLSERSGIEQVLLNLALNARDAMPDGGRLGVETRNEQLDRGRAAEAGLSPGSYVALVVADTGTGMSPEVRARLFEPFFTTKPSGQGTGLGLATVYGIVKQSRGSIRVDSRPGEGTVFRLYFPKADAESEAPPGGERAASATL